MCMHVFIIVYTYLVFKHLCLNILTDIYVCIYVYIYMRVFVFYLDICEYKFSTCTRKSTNAKSLDLV